MPTNISGLDELRVLHLSDIHFRRKVGDGDYDIDTDIRHEVWRDAGELSKKLGGVQAIFITGDTAFSGQEKEYKEAHTWLEGLCKSTGCEPHNVWMVPGNHDIDRAQVNRSKILQSLHNQIRSETDCQKQDKIFSDLMDDSEGPDLLYRPLSGYNDFSSRYSSQVNASQPYWEVDLPLNDSSVLKVRGINTSLLSTSEDNDRDHKLVLQLKHCVAKRQEGVEYLFLLHHPLDWLFNHDLIRDYLKRVRIALFGHKHRQRLTKIDGNLRLHAGAVNPDPNEASYEPRYNLLTVKVEGAGEDRSLEVNVYSRVWSPADTIFKAQTETEGQIYDSVSLKLPNWEPIAEELTPETGTYQASKELTGAGEYGMNTLRSLTYRYLSLPYHRRVDVASKCKLLRDEDKGINGDELFRRIFKRAKDENKLHQFWQAVEELHADGADPNKNPYKSEESE
ncbi:MAG: metallophosphoesterase [Pseudomonadota bacterium]